MIRGAKPGGYVHSEGHGFTRGLSGRFEGFPHEGVDSPLTAQIRTQTDRLEDSGGGGFCVPGLEVEGLSMEDVEVAQWLIRHPEHILDRSFFVQAPAMCVFPSKCHET